MKALASVENGRAILTLRNDSSHVVTVKNATVFVGDASLGSPLLVSGIEVPAGASKRLDVSQNLRMLFNESQLEQQVKILQILMDLDPEPDQMPLMKYRIVYEDGQFSSFSAA